MCLRPELVGDGEGINAKAAPKLLFFGGAVEFTVMCPADRDREFIADPAAKGPGLGKAQMMGIRRRAATNEARLRGDELPVPLVTQPTLLWNWRRMVRGREMRPRLG